MSEEDYSKRESHRIANARTEAIMSAIMMMRQPLNDEQQTSRVGSAYLTIRSIVYDMLEGTYWEGYTTGEDQSGRNAEIFNKDPK